MPRKLDLLGKKFGRLVVLSIEGERLPLAIIAERFGIKYHIVWRRYKKGLRGESLVAKD